MARPTFLVIGAMKCGTTSLHHYLGEHPEIQKLPAMKETNFFSGPPNGIPYPPGSKRIERLEEYEPLFDAGFDVRGEASPCYTLYPRRKGVPERIKEIVPDVKLIYLVRDPVDRALSQYLFSMSVENEHRPPAEALGDLSDPCSLYTCPGFYAMQIERYLRHFPQERMLVIDHADLLADRQAALREIFAFLSVDETFVSPRFSEEMNTGREQRTYSKMIVWRRRAQASKLAQSLPRGVRRSVRLALERLVSRPLEPPTLNDETRARLQDLYGKDAARLRKLTGKALQDWSV